MNPQATNPKAKRLPEAQGKPDTNPLASLHQYGQAPWLDFLARGFIAQGGLKQLVEHDGLTGVTSNPSIFEKAIAGSTEYNSSLQKIEAEGDFDVMTLYERLAIEDIREAAKVLRPVFEATKGADGYVSLEVSPYLAMSTEGTITEARDGVVVPALPLDDLLAIHGFDDADMLKLDIEGAELYAAAERYDLQLDEIL